MPEAPPPALLPPELLPPELLPPEWPPAEPPAVVVVPEPPFELHAAVSSVAFASASSTQLVSKRFMVASYSNKRTADTSSKITRLASYACLNLCQLADSGSIANARGTMKRTTAPRQWRDAVAR